MQRDKVNAFRYMHRAFRKIEAQIGKKRPDLVEPWRALQNRPMQETIDFLSRHFPIDKGWENVEVGEVATLIERHA